MSSRPNPVQWAAYAYGATLPESQRDWVRNDLTGRFAVPRHLIRSQFTFLPIYVLFFFAFPGEIGLRAAMVLLSGCLAFIFNVVYMDQNRARRMQKHGFEPTARTVRGQAEADAIRERYESIYADRRSAG